MHIIPLIVSGFLAFLLLYIGYKICIVNPKNTPFGTSLMLGGFFSGLLAIWIGFL
jgi:hypothetical protein